jgi:hypothetical protein
MPQLSPSRGLSRGQVLVRGVEDVAFHHARANSSRKRLISIWSAVTVIVDPAVGTHRRTFPMHLDPAEQGLLNQAQRPRCRRDALARLNKAEPPPVSNSLTPSVALVILMSPSPIVR